MSDPISTADSLRTLQMVRRHAGWRAEEPPTNDEAVAAHEEERARFRAVELEQRWVSVCRPRFAAVRWADVIQPPGVMADLEAWRDRAIAHATAPVVDPVPGNLVLVGPLGPGKTFAALAVARDLHFAGAKVAFVPAVEMLGTLRRGGREVPVTPYTAPDVLILDDLGAEKPSEWTRSAFYEVINSRWLDKRPMIVTTNLEPADLAETISDRNWDRIKDGAVFIRVTGASRRRPAE